MDGLPGATWTEVVPEAEHTITTWPAATATAGRLVLGYLVDARTEVRFFHLDRTPAGAVQLPRLGYLWSGFPSRLQDEEIFHSLSGAADPGTVFRLDPESGTSTPYLTPEVEHEVGDFVTDQVFYTARDGTRIPMFLVRHRSASLSEARPVWMYGYAFGWPAAPWHQPHIVAWMSVGGVFAVPNIRGSLAYGREWDEAGPGHNKQTAIGDYVDAAVWLSEEGYTTPELTVANASSVGAGLRSTAPWPNPPTSGPCWRTPPSMTPSPGRAIRRPWSRPGSWTRPLLPCTPPRVRVRRRPPARTELRRSHTPPGGLGGRPLRRPGRGRRRGPLERPARFPGAHAVRRRLGA